MKIKIMVLMFLSLSLFGKDWWSAKNEENNTTFFGNVSNLKIIKTKARTYSQIESELIQKAETDINKEVNTMKPKSPNRTYEMTSIRNDYELLKKIPEMGYFRWETEWEDTLFQISKAGTFKASQLVQKGLEYITDKNLITLSPIETLELYNVALDRVAKADKDGNTIIDETTVQTTIIYGRKINGIPVYGNGSKVVVRFDNIGEITMLAIDWKAIDYIADISNEKATLNEMDTIFQTTIKKPGQQYIERRCGYYDGGIKQQSFDLIPVCFYLYDNDKDERYGVTIPVFKNHDHLYYNK